MVIPSFYTHDNDSRPPCDPAAEHATPGNGRNQESSTDLVQTIDHHFSNEMIENGKPRTNFKKPQGPVWRESEIIANLFLGDLQDAGRFDGMIISVLPDAMAAEPKRTIRLPFLANGRATLDSTANLIDAALELGMRVLVHCEEGCERAPLVVAWFLKTCRGMSLDEAYALIKMRRPIVKARRSWLGIYNR